ncbi:MAG: hypothetical protein ACYTF8_05155 [Planctomycetota bacterium]|jgi:hypothetical protein
MRHLRALALILLAACGETEPPPAPPAEPEVADKPTVSAVEFRRRFLDQYWREVGKWEVEDLVVGLQAYVAGDDPIYPRRDRRYWSLHGFLFRTRPDPRGFLPLFGPHGGMTVDDPCLLKRDSIALAVVTSFIRRIFEDPKDPWRKELYDVIGMAGVHFSFDPAYGESHTYTGVEVGDFFGDAIFPVCEESRASLRRALPALLEQWRKRVTDKGTSSFFGVVLRHLGKEGAEVLFGEWARLNEDERYDLLKRVADQEALGPVARLHTVEALLDASIDVREAAFEALEAHEAPLGDLDVSARESDIEKGLAPLRQWARKTKS